MSLSPAADHAILATRLPAFSQAVDRFVQERLAAATSGQLRGMLEYHLGWRDENLQPSAAPGGKRVRPALCLLACEAAGGEWREALPSAAAVEMVHNFSLIHDDIEDASPLRRHRPTVWALWGVPLAINTGDAMLVEAQLAPLAANGPGERKLAAVELLGQACRALCAGQHRDLTPEATGHTLDAYYAMIEGKTAPLFATGATLGAL